jgi:hypothetical protein
MEQPDGSTCLPTSLLMVMNYLGRADLTTETVYALHERCQYDRYNVPAIVANYGLHAFPSWLEHAWTPATIEAELRAGRPVILGVDVSRPGHFVVAVGYTADGRVIIHDPYWKESGWFAGGANVVTDWDKLVWRNGIMIRTEPFPDPPRGISGTIVATTAPRTMVSGERAEVEITVQNNGREPWPTDTVLRPVDAYRPDWTAAERISPFAISSDIRPSHTTAPASENPVIHPGEVAAFRFCITAPTVHANTTFRENFNLYSPTAGWFSAHWQTGPSNREIFLRLAVVPRDNPEVPTEQAIRAGHFLTRNAAVPGGVELLHGDLNLPPLPEAAQPADAVSTTAPAILRTPPGKPFSVAHVGAFTARDYSVSAWMWLEYRPLRGNRGRGVNRVGLFARDSGQLTYGNKTELESGDSLVISYDSDDGRLRAGTFARGGVDDWRPRRDATYIRESGWHHLRIDCLGTSVTYFLDGQELVTQDLATTPATSITDYKLGPLFESGDAGVFNTIVAEGTDQHDPARSVIFADFRMRPLHP